MPKVTQMHTNIYASGQQIKVGNSFKAIRTQNIMERKNMEWILFVLKHRDENQNFDIILKKHINHNKFKAGSLKTSI